MSGENQDGDLGEVLKSRNADEPSYVSFINRTSRKVDIHWINYAGDRVKYRTISTDQPIFHVNTYATHPWVFREKDTETVLLCNGKEVFMPVPWDGETQTRTCAYIDIPVYSLRELCKQFITKSVHQNDIDRLEIPKFLKYELKDNEVIPHTEYDNPYGDDDEDPSGESDDEEGEQFPENDHQD